MRLDYWLVGSPSVLVQRAGDGGGAFWEGALAAGPRSRDQAWPSSLQTSCGGSGQSDTALTQAPQP